VAYDDAAGGSDEVVGGITRDNQFTAQKVHVPNARGCLTSVTVLPYAFSHDMSARVHLRVTFR